MVTRRRYYEDRARTFDEDIELIREVGGKDADGFPITVEEKTPVMANRLPITSNEFYGASQANYTIAKRFEIYSFEFDGQTALIHNGEKYRIARPYENGEFIELSCERVSDGYDQG